MRFSMLHPMSPQRTARPLLQSLPFSSLPFLGTKNSLSLSRRRVHFSGERKTVCPFLSGGLIYGSPADSWLPHLARSAPPWKSSELFGEAYASAAIPLQGCKCRGDNRRRAARCLRGRRSRYRMLRSGFQAPGAQIRTWLHLLEEERKFGRVLFTATDRFAHSFPQWGRFKGGRALREKGF